jgi:hypothetical protein
LAALDGAPEALAIDETCVYVEEAPRYGYSRKGQRCFYRRKQHPRSGKMTLLMAISERRGVVASMVVKGSINSASFASFIGSIDAAPGSVAILDNVSFHKSAVVRDAAARKEIKFLFIPFPFHTSEEPSVIYDPTKVVGVDPGRCNISSTVQLQADGSWKKCRLTRKQFYRDSHADKNLKKIQKIDLNNIAGEMAMLSECISKTASVEEFEKYLETKKRVDVKLWEHRLRRCFGLMAMDNYIHKRKTMDKFWKQTVGLKEDTVVAYGDAGFASSGRGERSVPTKTMRKAATRFSRLVVEVDEFNTSKTCCDCGACLLPIRIPGKTKPLRAVRRCGSIECNETPLKSRDWSAAINIFWRLVDRTKVPWLERRP